VNHKENALQIIQFGTPERVLVGPPVHHVAYRDCNHEGYVGGGITFRWDLAGLISGAPSGIASTKGSWGPSRQTLSDSVLNLTLGQLAASIRCPALDLCSKVVGCV
jgi:hypothetical protein